MKPILIFEHINTSKAGLFEAFLKLRSLPYQILYPNNGDEIPDPSDLSSFSGLCFLGGIESVTQPSQAMLREITLIKAAKKTGQPVIGHCLGGQLISKALGGEVTQHSLVEFGWSTLYPETNQIASQWLGNSSENLKAMQWHSDTFTIPKGATKILGGDFCTNQAFVYEKMLAMQFHVEIELDMIKHWASELHEKHPAPGDGVQTSEEILKLSVDNYELSRKLAKQLYSLWSDNL
ncbi:MAG: GMP synthase-like glutamine amidotransferase [Gammaproteobacteria bacterium]|jgi:GMP synthase-like glutamine amidotransferase